jgi:hypothetical protein
LQAPEEPVRETRCTSCAEITRRHYLTTRRGGGRRGWGWR